MGISRQAYYKRNRADAARLILDEKVADFVQQKRLRQPRLGTRKLYYLLQCQPQHELQVSRDRLFAILRERRLLVARKRAYHKTTDSHQRFRRHPNLLKPGPDQVVPSGPEQVWVADITYLPTQEGVAYLSLVTDAFSRKIVGYHVHESLHTASVAQALRRAVGQRKTAQPLVHHSDRGSQYCSGMYQELHAKHGIRCSMTDGYDCYQNALAERVNGILKTELLLQQPQDLTQAKKMVSESVSIYNRERPHLSLKYKTPDAMHRALG
ncbi:putative transposase [Pseudomonas fluorescens]|nr:putative transposase [Pseudomonas fluorescens]